ncbi:MAG: response regulator [Rhodocyclaceae bacterium]|nr:response regulator [Rhodocyclaceae bacterium]
MSDARIKVGYGWSGLDVASTAGTAAASAALAPIGDLPPALVLVFASVRYDLPELLRAIAGQVGTAPVLGATTAGEICGELRQGGVLVCIVATRHMRVHYGVGRGVGRDWRGALAEALAAPAIAPYFEHRPALWRDLMRRGSGAFGMVFSPGNTRSAASRSYEILEQLKARSLGQIAFVGGSSADDWQLQTNYVLAGGEAIADGLLVAVVETELQFGIAISHGFEPLAQETTVTSADGNEVLTLDGRPALDVFAELNGRTAADLAQRHLTISTGRAFGLRDNFGLYNLNVASFATPRGGLRLTRPVDPGTRLCLLEVQYGAGQDAAADALRKAGLRAGVTEPAAGLLWYCALRPKLMGDATQEELASAARLLAPAPLLGFSSFGEQGLGADGVPQHYNGAVSALVLGKDLTPGARVALENEKLRAELAARTAMLEHSHAELENLVASRTADLIEANTRLREEIAERQRAEQAVLAQARLEEQQRLLREHLRFQKSLIEAMPVPVFYKDVEGRYMGCNDAFAAFFGRPKDEIIGYTVYEVARGTLADIYRSRDLELLSDPAGVQVYESPIENAGGEVRDVVFHKARLCDDAGAPLGIIGAILDITDLKRADAARAAALAEAQRLARVRSDFLANMSHEIRTPLNVVLGLAQAGLRQSEGRHVRDTFERMHGAGQMLLALVNDILDFSKIEAGKLQIEHAAFAPGAVIDQAVSVVAQPAAGKGLDLQVNEAPDLPATCLGDALRLRQVLVNLLGNAVKFTEHGEVRLYVSRVGNELLVAVEDSGIGLSAEQMERLFTVFEQADGSTTRRYGGTGLGLAISRRLVELMRGTIEVQSKLGEGSRFEVRLPLVGDVAAEPPVLARIGLAGLPHMEGARLARALADYGQQVQILPAHAGPEGLDWIVADAALAGSELVMQARERGVPVQLAWTPGGGSLPDDGTDQPDLIAERPLRARHVIAALRAAPTAQGTPADEIRERLAGIRILAAEDVEMNRQVLQELLGGEGARLSLVENGQLAVDRVQAEGAAAFDVVLMDIQMPVLDGYQTADRLRVMAPGLPVIGLTAHAFPEERARCLAHGMVEHVAKPFDLDDLVAIILHHCAHKNPAPQVQPGAPQQQAGAAAQGVQAVDFEALNKRFHGKPGVVGRLATILVNTHQATPEKLRTAALQSDLGTLVVLAHALKGVGGNLCARGLQTQAEKTEVAARDGLAEAPAEARQLAQDLEAVLEAAGRMVPVEAG